MSRQQAYQKRHREVGLCERCASPIMEGYKSCERHRKPAQSRRPRWTAREEQYIAALFKGGMSYPDMAKAVRSAFERHATARGIAGRIAFMRKNGAALERRQSGRPKNHNGGVKTHHGSRKEAGQ